VERTVPDDDGALLGDLVQIGPRHVALKEMMITPGEEPIVRPTELAIQLPQSLQESIAAAKSRDLSRSQAPRVWRKPVHGHDDGGEIRVEMVVDQAGEQHALLESTTDAVRVSA